MNQLELDLKQAQYHPEEERGRYFETHEDLEEMCCPARPQKATKPKEKEEMCCPARPRNTTRNRWKDMWNTGDVKLSIKGANSTHTWLDDPMNHHHDDEADTLRFRMPTLSEKKRRTDNAKKLSLQMEAQDNINPSHYRQGKIECIDIINEMVRDKGGMEAVCVANATKYLYRYKNKGGVESVKKAKWYLEKLINHLEN